MNRRKFCLSSTAAAAAVGAGGLAAVCAATQAQATTAAGPLTRLYKFIYDRRFAACRAFAAAALRGGVSSGIEATSGDITELWSNDLRAQWSAGAGAIGGMVTTRALFCLEQLAKDHWMRVALRVEHDFVHRITASAAMIPRLNSALTAEDWPARMPAILAWCPTDFGAARVAHDVRRRGGSSWASPGQHLASFVIV
jgi:hypothetical protein